MVTRIKLPNDSELPEDVVERLNSLPPINVYRLIAKIPQCLIPWADMVKSLYECKVPIRLREIAIVRQASRAKSMYELHQHKFIAKGNGVTDEEIEHICNASKVNQLLESENLVCQMADELEQTATISDETREGLISAFGEKQCLELLLVTSFYCCVARVLNSSRIEIEKENPLDGAENPN